MRNAFARRAFAMAALALCLLGAALVAQAGGNADVVGTWNLEFNDGSSVVHPTLTLAESNGALSGQWSGPRGTADLRDAKYADGALTFKFKQKVMVREVDFSFSGKVDGDKLSGNLTTPRGEIPVTGAHAK